MSRMIVYSDREYREVSDILRAYDRRRLIKYKAVGAMQVVHIVAFMLLMLSIDSFTVRGLLIAGPLMIYLLITAIMCDTYRKYYWEA